MGIFLLRFLKGGCSYLACTLDPKILLFIIFKFLNCLSQSPGSGLHKTSRQYNKNIKI